MQGKKREKRDRIIYVIKGDIVKNEKGVQLQSWKLSSYGVACVFAYSQKETVVKRTAQNYESFIAPDYKGLFSSMEKELNNWSLMQKLLNLLGHTYLLYGSTSLDNATRTGLLSKNFFTPHEVIELSRIVPKFQPLKDEFQTARDQLDAILKGEE